MHLVGVWLSWNHNRLRHLLFWHLVGYLMPVTSLVEMSCVYQILFGGFKPSEKYESQLGWSFSIYGKIQVMFQTTNQFMFIKYKFASIPLSDARLKSQFLVGEIALLWNISPVLVSSIPISEGSMPVFLAEISLSVGQMPYFFLIQFQFVSVTLWSTNNLLWKIPSFNRLIGELNGPFSRVFYMFTSLKTVNEL